jgi:transposase-like protein
MDSENFTCPNPDCPNYNRHHAGNIALYTQYGRKQVRLLICRTCNKTFSELKGTPFWDSRLNWETIASIYQTLLDGKGIRATARLYGLSKNTVKRYLRLAKRDPATVEAFLLERGMLNGGQHNLRDLADRFDSGPGHFTYESNLVPTLARSLSEA